MPGFLHARRGAPNQLPESEEEPAVPEQATPDEVLPAGDNLAASVLEWTLHHLDLIAHLPGATEPPAESLARSREMLEEIAGTAFPASLPDKDALLVGIGRCAPTDAGKAELGELAAKLPLVLG